MCVCVYRYVCVCGGVYIDMCVREGGRGCVDRYVCVGIDGFVCVEVKVGGMLACLYVWVG